MFLSLLHVVSWGVLCCSRDVNRIRIKRKSKRWKLWPLRIKENPENIQKRAVKRKC